MSEKRIFNMQPGAIYNEHVDKQVFFQGTVNVQTSNGCARSGTPQQEQYMKPVKAICMEEEEFLPLSQMDGKIFHPSIDMGKLKGCIKDIGISPTERNKWCVVFLVLKENAIIASDTSEQEFLRWTNEVFGTTSTDFRHCLDGAKNLSTETWRDRIVAQKYIDFASLVRDIALSHETILRKGSDGNPLHLDSSLKWSKKNG